MIIYGDFLLEEYVVKVEHVRYGRERHWVHVAVPGQERLELHVLLVRLKVVVKFAYVEVLLGIVELVHVVVQIPFWEALLQPKLTCFERPVVDKGQHFSLGSSVINYFLPHNFISRLCEKQVVDSIEHRWIVKSISNNLETFFES